MMELLDYMKAKRILDNNGIHSVESMYVKSPGEALSFSGGEPIVMKLISGKALHKSKEGLVKLNLVRREEVEKAYKELREKGDRLGLKPYRIIVQKTARKGIEIIIGGKTDNDFGKMVLIGLGGIYVEAFRDFALGVCPVNGYDSMRMVHSLKSRDVITYQGKQEKEIEKLIEKVSAMLKKNEWIQELDLNPVIISENGYEIVDIRILR